MKRTAVQPVFVIGTGRCGSTLVQELVALHPATGFVSNLDDLRLVGPHLGRFGGPLYRRLPRSASRKGRPRFAPSEAYRALGREVSPVLVDPCRDLTAQDVTPWLAGRLRLFFDDRAAAQRCGVFVHKFTGWPRARFLQTVFPDARFVEVVRDGRAVANSFLQAPWFRGHAGADATPYGPLGPEAAACWHESGRSFVALAGLVWAMLTDACEDARLEIESDRWMRVRYEDVVDAPEGALGEICRFAGLEPTRSYLEAVAGRGVTARRLDAYLGDLEPAQVKELESVEAPQLRRLGYLTP